MTSLVPKMEGDPPSINALPDGKVNPTIMKSSNPKFNSMSMEKLMALDPPKYGWTAIGGVASILTPHEMARRPEAKEQFLKRQKDAVDDEAKGKEQEVSQSFTIEIEGSDKPKGDVAANCSKPVPKDATNPAENLTSVDNSSKKVPPVKKISIKSTNDKGVVDIYTYHRGRVGEEPRDEITGELLCDTEPIDTNHGWIPPKTVVRVIVKFPLADPDDDYVDSDLDEEETNETKDDDGGNVREPRSRPTRSSLSPNKNSLNPSTLATKSSETQPQQEAIIPFYREVIQWDMSDPRYPPPLEYASNIGAEFGLNFSQTMELAESIQAQLDDFIRSKDNYFYAPIVTHDPYGSDRPVSHYGPPESFIFTGAPGSRGSLGAGGGAPRRNPAMNRSNSGLSRKSAASGSSARAPRSRAFKGITEVVPEDQVPVAGKAGDKYSQEVLKRAKAGSQTKVAELLSKNEEAMWIKANENCHICHVRRDCGLMFNCGKHLYCDNHCATRLSFRVHDYDPKNPKKLPIDHCPVCSVKCVCAKCTRRLETVTEKMKGFCEAQNCEPENVVMDAFELCSGYNRLGLGSGSGGGSLKLPPPTKKALPKKVKANNSNTTETPIPPSKNAKRDRSVMEDAAHQSSSRSTRSSPLDAKEELPSGSFNRKPAKKRKLNLESWGVVKKVCPAEFPKELHGAKDMDPSQPGDDKMVFTPEGMIRAEPAVASGNNSYQNVITVESERNFYHCFACKTDDEPANLACCKKCPRAYHVKCLKKDGCSADVNALPGNWECHRCDRDKTILEAEEKISKMKKSQEIVNAFSKFNTVAQFQYTTILLTTIFNIVSALKEHDHGIIFSEPVDCAMVRDYRDIISTPMDYGTITTKLAKGGYVRDVTHVDHSSSPKERGMNALEEILFSVICDVEQVHHNCLLYNSKGSNYYRCGDVHRIKWQSFFNKFVADRLTEPVRNNLKSFRKKCKSELQASSRSRHFQVEVGDHPLRKTVAVFDPDTKMIVKQYSSKKAAVTAAMILKNAGYECEVELTSKNAKERLRMTGEDPSKLIFGYRWILTDELRSGKFKSKDWTFRDDDLVSPTSTNTAVLRIDSVSGSMLRGFESEEAAFQDWLKIRAASIGPVDGNDSTIEFQKKFLDGKQSIDGVVWKRAESNTKESYPESGKVVLEQIYAKKVEQIKHESD